jgi:hypothetical protein
MFNKKLSDKRKKKSDRRLALLKLSKKNYPENKKPRLTHFFPRISLDRLVENDFSTYCLKDRFDKTDPSTNRTCITFNDPDINNIYYCQKNNYGRSFSEGTWGSYLYFLKFDKLIMTRNDISMNMVESIMYQQINSELSRPDRSKELKWLKEYKQIDSQKFQDDYLVVYLIYFKLSDEDTYEESYKKSINYFQEVIFDGVYVSIDFFYQGCNCKNCYDSLNRTSMDFYQYFKFDIKIVSDKTQRVIDWMIYCSIDDAIKNTSMIKKKEEQGGGGMEFKRRYPKKIDAKNI